MAISSGSIDAHRSWSRWEAKRPLEIVHGDLYGPITPTTLGGKKLFLLLMDDFSQFMWSILLRSKDKVTEEEDQAGVS
jgi:hypothetical protein